jgi:hypothetical protein
MHPTTARVLEIIFLLICVVGFGAAVWCLRDALQYKRAVSTAGEDDGRAIVAEYGFRAAVLTIIQFSLLIALTFGVVFIEVSDLRRILLTVTLMGTAIAMTLMTIQQVQMRRRILAMNKNDSSN